MLKLLNETNYIDHSPFESGSKGLSSINRRSKFCFTNKILRKAKSCKPVNSQRIVLD